MTWGLVITIVLNLQSTPLFPANDGAGVWIRTTSFKIALGDPNNYGHGFATKAACEAYEATGAYLSDPYFLTPFGLPQQEFQNIPMTVVGCEKVLE